MHNHEQIVINRQIINPRNHIQEQRKFVGTP